MINFLLSEVNTVRKIQPLSQPTSSRNSRLAVNSTHLVQGLSERVPCALDAVNSLFPSLLVKFFYVKASTRIVVCLFISKNLWLTIFCSELVLRPSKSSLSKSFIWSVETTSGKLHYFSLSLYPSILVLAVSVLVFCDLVFP